MARQLCERIRFNVCRFRASWGTWFSFGWLAVEIGRDVRLELGNTREMEGKGLVETRYRISNVNACFKSYKVSVEFLFNLTWQVGQTEQEKTKLWALFSRALRTGFTTLTHFLIRLRTWKDEYNEFVVQLRISKENAFLKRLDSIGKHDSRSRSSEAQVSAIIRLSSISPTADQIRLYTLVEPLHSGFPLMRGPFRISQSMQNPIL